MKKKVVQVNSNDIFKVFEDESIEDVFVASDNIRDIAFVGRIGTENILNFPFRVGEVIVVMCINGCLKAKLEAKDFSLEKNTMLVILPNKIFEIMEIAPDFRSICFIMKENFWDKRDGFLEAIKLQQYFFNRDSIQLPENIVEETLTIYKLIKGKITEKGLFSRQIIQQYTNVLFYNVHAILQQHNMQKQAEKPPTKEYVFEQFIRLVERNYKQQHKIGFYADKLHLTGKYLSALIRSASGKTAAQCIRGHLVMEARMLLKSGRMSIQQVSNELNFYDQSHFGVFFKKYVGCSPRAYQKM
ncbi:MAG: helix-turn-helix domain-containing protein [Prevotellaceae bacterium]|jgi:AraC-like DNA-binding protein|nr:helix-turn-helix domain-containing protein [Prevotellaceae bacterium]